MSYRVATAYRRRLFGRDLELSFYLPTLRISLSGVVVQADTTLIFVRKHRQWAWSIGVRLAGFGVALCQTK